MRRRVSKKEVLFLEYVDRNTHTLKAFHVNIKNGHNEDFSDVFYLPLPNKLKVTFLPKLFWS